MEWFEDFFITKISDGLKLRNDELTEKDKDLLCAITLFSPQTEPQKIITELNNLFKEYKINNAQEWNNKIAEALNEAFDEDIRNYKDPEDKKFRKKFEKLMMFSSRHPKIDWNEALEDLYKHSKRITLSGIVQNWYFKHGKGRVYRWRI